jgi:hypothetical protein
MPLTDRDHFDSAAQTCPYVVGRTTLHCSLTPLAEKERAELQSEIDSLRLAIRRLADQDATLSVCDGAVTVTMDGTLTDAEREAIAAAIRSWPAIGVSHENVESLRGLLDRLG